MNLSEMDNKERVALMGGLLLVAIVFTSAAYIYFNPPVQTWEGKVFDVSVLSNGNTVIFSYGEGKIGLSGNHEIELGATYRITYKSRTRDFATVLISLEKIDG